MTETQTSRSAALDDLLAELADEFAQSVRRGEHPDIESCARRHPHLADVIRQVFPALKVLNDPALESMHDADSEESAEADRVIGDYRIVREVGRGGMGVVYEALQLSLQRRVALKVLPFAGVLDPRQLARFKNEALAAARLEHPHIVDVHAVGCERAVHFYAMQFIDGQNLAEVIRELRRLAGTQPDPPRGAAPPGLISREEDTALLQGLSTAGSIHTPAFFRTVARLGVEAAEALDYAHQHGIVHRDVKPSNLMLDSRGKLWITDFGLAQVESDAGVTMSGDILGTLRYMSPEQAAGNRRLIDHRSDIYSLGATLYELLTLQPVFPETDRQKLLQQIAHEEPAPPRKLNASIPADLETVLLTAMAQDPLERYTTSGELADDLRRFLSDRPIRARRMTAGQRALKWIRRHPSLAWSVVLALTLATIGLAVSNVLIARERDAKAVALHARDVALSQKQRALEEARQSEARAVSEAAKARALSGLMKEILLSASPYSARGADYTLRQLLDDFTAGLDDQLHDQPEVEAEVRSIIGWTYRTLGMPGKAEPHLAAALELRRRIYGEVHEQVLDSLMGSAWNANSRGDFAQAETLTRDALAIARKLDDPPSVIRVLAGLQTFLKHQKKYADADAAGYEALSLARESGRGHNGANGSILHLLAASKLGQGDAAEAERLARRALEHALQARGRDHPETAWIQTTLASILGTQGRHTPAETLYREALATFRKHYGDENPVVASFLRVLGVNLVTQRKSSDGEACLREALSISRTHLARHPANMTARNVHQWTLRNLFNIYAPKEQWDRIVADCSPAVELQPEAGNLWHDLGVAHYRLGNVNAALAAFEQSAGLQDDGDGAAEFYLAMIHWRLGNEQEARRRFADAVKQMDQTSDADATLRSLRKEAATLIGIENPID